MSGTALGSDPYALYYKTPTEERYIDRVLPYHDLIYLQDGSWNTTESELEYPLEKGDVLLLAAGRHHYTRLPCLPETRTFCIHITCEQGDSESAFLHSTGKNMCLPTLLHMRQSHKIKSYFEDIVSAFWRDSQYKHEEMSALLDLLFLELQREHEQQSNRHIDIAERAIEIITSNPHKRYQSKEVAAMLYISTKTLDNAMIKKVGMPFYSYQKDCKLNMVASLLEMEPDMRLQEIAIAYGFHDEFHMSKAFKKKYHMSPKAYQKMKLG